MGMPNNFRRVYAGIYAGAMPTLQNVASMKKQLNIMTVVTLNADGADKIKDFINQINLKLDVKQHIRHIIIPVSPFATMVDDKIKYLIRNIVEILTNSQPVYIHCLQGQDRTGLAIGIFLIKRFNKDFVQVLSEINKYNFGNGIGERTYKLFITILKSLSLNGGSDISSADDAVFLAREFFKETQPSQGIQSFAPYADLPYESLEFKESNEETDDPYNGVPMMGSYHNQGPIRGSGPVENSGGGIINVLDGLE